MSEKEQGTSSPDDLWYPSLIISLNSRYGQHLLSSSSSSFAYKRLLSHFEPQQRSDFCGIASGVILLKRLQPKYKWTQSNLHATIAPTSKSGGMTLPQLSDMLEKCDVSSIIRYCHDEKIEEQFRRDMKEAQNLVIVNYWRQYEEGENNEIQRSGHFSPIGAFHEKTDRVLIMDTYQPHFPHHWVKVKELMRMMRAKDEEENAPRGYLIVTDGTVE